MDACRLRRMKVVEQPSNLLEARVQSAGNLDGMKVRVDVNCISGMPGESPGIISFHGNLTQLMSVLNRVWPMPSEAREVASPGRQSWPDHKPTGSQGSK
jgi:hypothetical protein